MSLKWSDRTRQIAEREYIAPARKRGGIVRIRLGDLQNKVVAEGCSRQRTPLIAGAIESDKFCRQMGVERLSPKGLPRRVDTVFEFRFIGEPSKASGSGLCDPKHDPLLALVGTLKHAFSEGAEAFLRDIRRDKEQDD